MSVSLRASKQLIPSLSDCLDKRPAGPLWVFAYASLIWRPEFEPAETRKAQALGWHRALKMWSRIYRGTPEQPGLVCGLLPGGSCLGMVLRLPAESEIDVLELLWRREMINSVYQARWVDCQTRQGAVRALAFTLPKNSPSHTGTLSDAEYRRVLHSACGCAGTTLEYTRSTVEELRRHGIRDQALERILKLSQQPC